MLLKFKIPYTLQINGPSGAGKSFLVLELLKHRSPFKRIIWCNKILSAIPDDIRNSSSVIISEGLPDDNILENISREPMLLILDDLMKEAFNNDKVCSLFTRDSHHRNISVILLTQNLFHQAKNGRDVALNCKYLIVFKNPRDKSQIMPLARQIYPSKPSEVVRVYNDATRKPHSYLLFDLTQDTNDIFRFRTNILDSEIGEIFCPIDLLNQCEKYAAIEGKQTYIACVTDRAT